MLMAVLSQKSKQNCSLYDADFRGVAWGPSHSTSSQRMSVVSCLWAVSVGFKHPPILTEQSQVKGLLNFINHLLQWLLHCV